jgi:hypothetical protein
MLHLKALFGTFPRYHIAVGYFVVAWQSISKPPDHDTP